MADEFSTGHEGGPPGGPAAAEAPSATAVMAAGFRGFGRDQWVAWINKFLNGELCEPRVLAGNREPHMVLADIYGALETKSQRDEFAAAVAVLFECTAPIRQHARYFYYLIEMIAFLTPYQAKALARARLEDRTFAGMEYGMQDLHTLLLVANGKYDPDADLIDFVRRTARTSTDFGYLLVCQRIISALGGREHAKFLDVLLPHVNAEPCAARLARQLRAILLRLGYRHFAEWYGATARALRPADARLFDAFQLFEGGLKRIVFRRLDLARLDRDDPHRALVAAQLHAYDRRFNAREVVSIARLHAEVGQAAVVDALVNIWRRIETGQKGQPWWYNAPPSVARARLPASVSSGPNPNASVSESFMTGDEPVLDAIFEKVTNECEYGLGGAVLPWRSARAS